MNAYIGLVLNFLVIIRKKFYKIFQIKKLINTASFNNLGLVVLNEKTFSEENE